MDDAEKAARIAELEQERTGLALECTRLGDELHGKRNRLQNIELSIELLRRGLDSGSTKRG